MQPYLICLDLDCTLLNDNKEISPYTKQVLTELQQCGHYVMIATGRPYRASQMYYHELNMSTPVVNFNGAFVHHPKANDFKVIHEVLDVEISKNIITALQQSHITNIIAEVKDYVFINSYDPRLFEGFSMGNPKIQTGNLLENLNDRRWGAPFPVIEIVKRGINKARGIKHVQNYLNIADDHIIAFGDEDNDIEMIKFANHGIAMANGLKDLKEIANETTFSNNEDGIGRYLNDFFNLKMRYY